MERRLRGQRHSLPCSERWIAATRRHRGTGRGQMSGPQRVWRKGAADFYRQLYLIRRVEERICEIYPSDKIKSPVHLSIGQEAVAVGVSQALRPDDIVSGTYRGHAIYLARGGDLRGMFAELYGRAAGVA